MSMKRPGGELAKRPLHVIWLVDCSGSMKGKKIQSLNHAINEALQPMRDVADENPNAEVLGRVICFADNATWKISQPTEIHKFKWEDLEADGETAMGKACALAADALKTENMPSRGLPPLLILVSDGQPTDNFKDGLAALLTMPWGQKAVRVAVAIGEDADLQVLRAFIAHPEIEPFKATNVQDLCQKIKLASTVPLRAASQPTGPLTSLGAATPVAAGPTPATPPAATPTDIF